MRLELSLVALQCESLSCALRARLTVARSSVLVTSLLLFVKLHVLVLRL